MKLRNLAALFILVFAFAGCSIEEEAERPSLNNSFFQPLNLSGYNCTQIQNSNMPNGGVFEINYHEEYYCTSSPSAFVGLHTDYGVGDTGYSFNNWAVAQGRVGKWVMCVESFNVNNIADSHCGSYYNYTYKSSLGVATGFILVRDSFVPAN